MINKNSKKINKADLLKYKALHRIISQDKITIYYDYEKLNRNGSPIYNPWENLLPILFPLFIGFGMIFLVGIFAALILITAVCFLYVYYLRKFIYLKLKDRTKQYILSSIERFEELWNLGALILVTKDNENLGCFSPEGDWRDFVVKYYSEYMTDAKIEEKTDKKDENLEENEVENKKRERKSTRTPRVRKTRTRRNER